MGSPAGILPGDLVQRLTQPQHIIVIISIGLPRQRCHIPAPAFPIRTCHTTNGSRNPFDSILRDNQSDLAPRDFIGVLGSGAND